MPVSKWLSTRRIEDSLSRTPLDQGTYILRTRKLNKPSVCLLSPSAVRNHWIIWTNIYSKKDLSGGMRFFSVNCRHLWLTDFPLTNCPCKCILALGLHQHCGTSSRRVHISVLISKSLSSSLLLLLFLL